MIMCTSAGGLSVRDEECNVERDEMGIYGGFLMLSVLFVDSFGMSGKELWRS